MFLRPCPALMLIFVGRPENVHGVLVAAAEHHRDHHSNNQFHLPLRHTLGAPGKLLRSSLRSRVSARQGGEPRGFV